MKTEEGKKAQKKRETARLADCNVVWVKKDLVQRVMERAQEDPVIADRSIAKTLNLVLEGYCAKEEINQGEDA